MKKLLALVALVAMVAMSSVSYAAETALTTANVTLTSDLDVADCQAGTGTALAVTFVAGGALNGFDSVQYDDCVVNVDAGSTWDLNSQGTNNAAGDMISGSDSIGGFAGDITAQAEVEGGAWGLWLVNTTGNVAVDNCTANTVVCADSSTVANNLVVDGDPIFDELFSLHIGVAVDNTGVVQPVGTYTDTINLTLI